MCYNIGMKKIRQTVYYVIFMVICLVGVAVPVSGLELTEGEESAKCDGCQVTLSESQKAAIIDHCVTIKENLKTLQKNDARARVYLGGKYELILSKYIMPLNVRLVENSLSATSLVERQNKIASEKNRFANDYVNYQQGLEELVGMDCAAEPEAFYNKLVTVRQKRQSVEQDVQKIRDSLTKYTDLVKKMREELDAKS